MVSFSKLGQLGRLGNQVVQIASTLGIAEKLSTTAAFPNWQYQSYFEEPLPSGPMGTTPLKEKRYEYDEYTQDNVDLQGYFQSWKYFGSKIPRLKQSFLNTIKLPEGEKICIHIRRGDYVNHEAYYQLPVTYYIQALMTIPNWRTLPIIFVSDDIGYCKTHFECLPNAHFPKGKDIEHLAMMSLCDHHILSNSSFSWWGAYLSKQSNVIYPSKYFRGSYADKSTRDLWPDNWHEFDVTDTRLDCDDMTFTIPVMWDHHDRKKNLDLSLCHLQKYLKSHYIVGECMTDVFGYISEWATYVKYPYKDFHRTKMLNQMAELSTTPYIANWDCDIFIPPLQIWLTCETLRNGGQMVYPYDGRFARMDRFPWFKKIESTVDIGVVSDTTPLSGRQVKESVGGAVCWNKDAFIEYGLENEYMVSYAPEDVERYERAFKLGAKIDKTPGTLYHMDHFKGPDSSNRCVHFPRSKALLETYRKMTADELRKEVDTWAWRHQYSDAYYERFVESAKRSAKETYAAIGFPGAMKPALMPLYPDTEIIKGPYLSVIDIGCGLGEWANGNPNYIGVDHGINRKKLLIPEENYLDMDFEQLKNAPGQILGKFDLCVCLEVAEHLSETCADNLIKWLCSLSNMVLFSAAIPGQGGTGHINEQWQSYWGEKFVKNGFGAGMSYPVKDNEGVDMWYRQNMILYHKGFSGAGHNFILPEYYEQIILHRDNQIQELSDRCASLMKRVQ